MSPLKSSFNYSFGEGDGTPRIVTDGLVLNLDAARQNSYAGIGTAWRDLSGNGNTGTLTNGPTYSSGNGGSLSFDGVDDYTLLGNISQLQFERTDSFSCSCFTINKDINAVALSIIGNSQTAPGYKGWTFNFFNRSVLKSNAICLALYSIGATNYLEVQTAPNSITANLWYHVAFTYIGNSISSGINLYINGINQSTIVSSNSLTSSIKGTENLYIGSRGAGVGQYLNGNISNLQVYNRALSASEISQNFNAIRGRFGI